MRYLNELNFSFLIFFSTLIRFSTLIVVKAILLRNLMCLVNFEKDIWVCIFSKKYSSINVNQIPTLHHSQFEFGAVR